MTQDEEKYTSAGRELLEKAQEALTGGDLRQASEKGWGAAAQVVKAVAARRGWQHRSHAALFEVANRLVAETGDRQLSTQFHVAGNLHMNFYENWLPTESVQSALENVQELVQTMQQFLD